MNDGWKTVECTVTLRCEVPVDRPPNTDEELRNMIAVTEKAMLSSIKPMRNAKVTMSQREIPGTPRAHELEERDDG